MHVKETPLFLTKNATDLIIVIVVETTHLNHLLQSLIQLFLIFVC